MEPFSALSVATAAVQFVEFSYKTVTAVVKAYQTIDSSGSQQSFQELRDEVKRLESTNLRLIASLDKDELGRPPTKTETDIVVTATRCSTVAKMLLDALRNLNVEKDRDMPWAQRMEKLKAAVKSAWKKGQLMSLQDQLVKLRDQLSLVILLDLREDIKSFTAHIAAGKEQSQSIWGYSSTIKNPDSPQIRPVDLWQKNTEIALHDVLESRTELGNLRSITKKGKEGIKIIPWSETAFASSVVDWLLHRLKFPEISTRERRVGEAHQKTFEWIFSHPAQKVIKWYSFTNWLKNDQRLFWITGKAGSGKSTLMKFLLQDNRTRAYLKFWAKDMNLVVASYYFWLAGAETLQHSQEGLLRTLLYDALGQLKQLNTEAALKQWNALALFKDLQTEWTWTDLEQAFRSLLDDTSADVRYCFFIDGLDELKGDISRLLSLIQKISQYSHVKICVSSRPWFIFGDEFSKKPHLRLEDLTYPDIKLYVESKLSSNVAFKELQMMNTRIAQDLMEEITQKSSGVFLWVVIVVLSLEEGLREGDRLVDLRQKLDSLPPELDDLFRQILHNFDPRYIKQASALFQMVKSAPIPLSLLTLSLADEDDTTLTVQAMSGLNLSSPNQRFYRALNMRRRLDSRCKGLLEAAPVLVQDIHLAGEAFTLDTNHLAIPAAGYHKTSDADSITRPDSAPKLIQQQNRRSPVIVVTCPSTDNLVPQAGSTSITTNSTILRDFSKLPPEQGDLLTYAKVEYLHRTVKDFLDQPNIWEEITSSTDDNFNPYLSIARSYLLQLKWVHQSSLSISHDKSWEAIFWILEYCVLAEAADVDNTSILEDLRKIMLKWFNPTTNLNLGNRWPIQHSAEPADFLHLAVKCGLRLYLEKKLNSAKFDGQYIEALLETSISGFKITYNHPGGTKFQRNEPDIALIQMLLRHSNLSPEKMQMWLQRKNVLLAIQSSQEDLFTNDFYPATMGNISMPAISGSETNTTHHSLDSNQDQQSNSFVKKETSNVQNIDTSRKKTFGRKLLALLGRK